MTPKITRVIAPDITGALDLMWHQDPEHHHEAHQNVTSSVTSRFHPILHHHTLLRAVRSHETSGARSPFFVTITTDVLPGLVLLNGAEPESHQTGQVLVCLKVVLWVLCYRMST